MTLDQFHLFYQAAQNVKRDEMVRNMGAMRIAMNADEKQYKEIMKEMES